MRLRLLAPIALLLPLLAGVPAGAGAASATALGTDAEPGRRLERTTIERVGTVDVRAIPVDDEGVVVPARPLPRRSPPRPDTPGPRPRTAATAGAESAGAESAGVSPAVLSGPSTTFTMTSQATQAPVVGGVVAPPDPQIAVSTDHVVEMVNITMSIFTRSGTRLTGPTPLANFFAVPSGYRFSDPRVVFDAATQRWFATGIGFDCADSSCSGFSAGEVYLAVSQTADPAGSWTQYVVVSNQSAVGTATLYDQAKLGFNADKVTIGWDGYAPNFKGGEVIVIEKSPLLAGTTPAAFRSGEVTGWFSVAPAESLSSTTTAYAAYNRNPFGFESVGVITITGTPAAGNVILTQSNLAIRETTLPPPAPQAGTSSLLDTGDDRFLHSVWQDGLLWTFGSTGCVPQGDTQERACGRLVQVNTAGTPSVRQDFDIGATGSHYFFPAVTFNDNGDSVVVASRSSSTSLASVIAGGQLDTELGRMSNFVTVKAGERTYDETPGSGQCFGEGTSPSRWGDYAAAVPDPTSADVWVASEYPANTTNSALAPCNWAAVAARVGFAAPVVTSVVPSVGNNGGGDTVVINGTGFTTSSSVAFNATPAASVTVNSSTKLTVTTPSGFNNVTVDVRVSTEYGTSANTSADNYRFTAPAVVTGVSPSSGTSAGGTVVTLTGQRFTGATAVKFGGTPAASFTVNSDTKITAVTPPRPVGTVNVIVDVGPVAGSATTEGRYTFVPRSGYWMVDRTGHVYAFGEAKHYGALNGARNNVADIEPTRTANGYWLLTESGEVFTYGDAQHHGQPGPLPGGELTTAMSGNPVGPGYWVFTNRGRVFAYGGVPHKGDMSGTVLNGPVLGSVATPTGQGYYMVASDGGIFAFPDARFAGSMGGRPLNGPVVGLAPDADNDGYWLVATDGGIFAFSAAFRGSMGGQPLNRPVVGMVGFGNGYLMVASDGGIFNFSDKPFHGSLGSNPPPDPVVNVAPLNI